MCKSQDSISSKRRMDTNSNHSNNNPQDAQRRPPRKSVKLSAARAVFEQKNHEQGFDTPIRGNRTRKLMPKSRRQQSLRNPNGLGRSSAHTPTLPLLFEEHHSSAESSDQAAKKIQRLSRQWSNQNKVRRQSQLDEFQELQKKREKEVHRLERIKQGRKIQNIRSSVDVFDKTIEKNKEFGFQCAKKQEEEEEEEEEEQSLTFDGEQSLTFEQLQQDHEAEKYLKKAQTKNTNSRPSRQPSAESTLSPIRVPARAAVVGDSVSTLANGSVPKIIAFGSREDPALANSEITLNTKWTTSSNSQKTSRWEAHPKKYPPAIQEQDPIICWRLPQPSNLKQPEEGSRWAVHPRVVYGKPKTEKSVQPDRQQTTRWAATAPGKKKKPQLPENGSRWAAQGPKKKLPTNGSRLPRRQITKDGSVVPRKKNTNTTNNNIPRRQTTKESVDYVPAAAAAAPRRGRRRTMVLEKSESLKVKPQEQDEKTPAQQSNSMPMVERGDDITTTTSDDPLSLTPKVKIDKHKLLRRSLSLGQVKQIVSAARIQSVWRMYHQRYQYQLSKRQHRKQEIENETAKELQHIRECLLLKQKSLRQRMERDCKAMASFSVSSSDTDTTVADSLRSQISELEKTNLKLESQCERLRASNGRMQRGNKTRESALKEVQGRLTKLQHIQQKLNKVQQDFEMENVTIQSEVNEINAKLRVERGLQETTKQCLRGIISLCREILEEENVELMEEVEDMVPMDCLK